MAEREPKSPDFWAISLKTLTPVGLLREKHRLIQFIVSRRKKEGLSQADLGRRVDISQSRMAQIEAGIEKGPVSFDLVFLLLSVLGLDMHIITRPRRVLKSRPKRSKSRLKH